MNITDLLKPYGLLLGTAGLFLVSFIHVLQGDASGGLFVALFIGLFGVWNELRILNTPKHKKPPKKKRK